MKFSTILAIFIMSNIFNENIATDFQEKENIVKDELVYEHYIELDKNLQNIVNNGIKNLLPYIMEANEHLNLSSRCVNNLFILTAQIRKLKLSAMEFLDAAGKLLPGFFRGTFNMIGDYDQCLSLGVLGANGDEAFHGQYCMLNMRAILPAKKRKLTLNSGLEELVEYTKNTSEFMQFLVKNIQYSYWVAMKYGLCVPSGCTEEDINMMVTYLGKKLYLNVTVQYCDQQYELKLHTGMIVAMSAFAVAGILVIVGSSTDYYARKREMPFKKSLARFLICFSVLTNFPKIINTKTQDTMLTSLFGIRTLSLFYVILGHQCFFWGLYQVNGHGLLFTDQLSSFFSEVINNSFLTTDVFFFLGGLLNTYSRMKIQAEGKRQINFIQIIIHRLWRIYPTYIFSIFTFYLFVNVYGPMATFMREEFIKPCEERWWENLLFINNYSEQDKVCMVHTWYIAADMQLFLLSLLTVPVLFKSEKKGIILHIALLISGLIMTVLWAWHKDLMPGAIIYYLEKEDINKVWNAYATVIPHIAPYFTGLITGYVLSKWNHSKIPRIYRLLGWPVATACFISMLFMTQKWNSGGAFTLIESAFYFAFCRFLYVLAVAWMMVCCAAGYGGILNYILSLKIWIPFSRISYMVYMVAPLLQMHYYATVKMLLDVDYMTMIWRHIGDLGVSCLLGLVLVVIVESPFISMEKLIFHRSPTKNVSENDIEDPEKRRKNDEIIKEIELINNEKNRRESS